MSDEKERQMWCASLQIAWDDLFAPAPKWRKGINEWMKNRREALLFFTKKTGKWAEARRDVCGVVGLDADAIRDHAIAEIAGHEALQESEGGH